MVAQRERLQAAAAFLTMAFLFLAATSRPAVAQQAIQPGVQQSDNTANGDTTGGFGKVIGDLLRAIGNPAAEPGKRGQSGSAGADPTVPSEKVLSRLPASPQTLVERRNQTVQRQLPMPTIPRVAIRGIVLSSASKGTAVIDLGDETLSINLIPRQQQRRVSIPREQFADLLPAIEQRLRAATESTDDTPPLPNYDMCPRCSFSSASVVFNVEDFNADSLLLRVLPHDSLVLVRR